MKKILVIQSLRPEALKIFDARKDISYELVTDFSEQSLLAKVGDADAITIRTAAITKRLLEAAPRLKVISRHGVGYDNIPVNECTARGIPVTIVGSVQPKSSDAALVDKLGSLVKKNSDPNAKAVWDGEGWVKG